MRECDINSDLFFTSIRVLCIKFHNALLRVGVNRAVGLISWAGVAFTLALTLGHVIEIYFWLEPTMMPAFCYFKILRPNKSRLKVGENLTSLTT